MPLPESGRLSSPVTAPAATKVAAPVPPWWNQEREWNQAVPAATTKAVSFGAMGPKTQAEAPPTNPPGVVGAPPATPPQMMGPKTKAEAPPPGVGGAPPATPPHMMGPKTKAEAPPATTGLPTGEEVTQCRDYLRSRAQLLGVSRRHLEQTLGLPKSGSSVRADQVDKRQWHKKWNRPH